MNARTTPPTIGSLIDQLQEVREEKRLLAAKDKELSTTAEALTKSILEMMDAQGTQKASSKKATASIGYETIANVEDWTKWWAFLHKNKYDHMMQRRVSDPAYRELLQLAETDKKLAKQLSEAGVVPFTKVKLSLRNI